MGSDKASRLLSLTSEMIQPSNLMIQSEGKLRPRVYVTSTVSSGPS